MLEFIPKTSLNLILFLLLISLTGCNNSTASHLKKLEVKNLVLPSGEKIKTYIADDPADQKRGLSKIQPEDFSKTEGMLFTGKRMFLRQFWMPETFFNLDIIFLNADLYVLDIHKNIKHHKTREPKHLVPLSKEVFSQHVLEIRADSHLSSKIQPGMILKWE